MPNMYGELATNTTNESLEPGLHSFSQWNLLENPIKDGNNWYMYASNNPLRFYDPIGLEAIVFTENANVTETNMSDATSFSQNDFKDSSYRWDAYTMTEDFSDTACAATALLNELSTEYTSMTGEALDFDTASKMMFGGVKSLFLNKKNANVDSWEGVANTMWSQTGKSLNGQWTFSNKGSHNI